MKIGMFINYYTPSKGGMETSVINLSKGLEKAGHEVFIFAPKYPNYKDEEDNIFRYKSIRFNYGGYFYVIPVLFGSKMKEIIKELKLDIIHSHQPYSLGSEAMKFSKELNIPLVFTYHIKYEDYSHYIPLVPSSISKKYIRKITVGYSNKCDTVISPSTAIKKLLEDHGIKTSVKIVPSGINIDNFANDTGKKKETREKYKIKQDEIMLITACRLTKEKNLEFLVKSFAKISQKDQNIKFMIVGDGAVKKDLEKMAEEFGIKNRVIFTGLVDRTEIVSLYQASDIFVFASKTETQGLVAVEAMAAGCPVVAVRASGIEDIVKDGEDGFLTSESEEEFSESVLKITRDNDLRLKMSVNAKTNSRKFEIAPWVEKIIDLYESLI
ncbi:MAG: glycosyltransferase family 4 protein [Candidatus Pacebacteria bacterium]|nr:glycosyltransferase family 4 protein [Candidatus Paceibacterota bacterium]